MPAWTLRGLAAVLMLVPAAAASGGSTQTVSGRCSRPLPTTTVSLPQAVTVATDCGRFRLGRSGSVVRVGARTLPVPRIARGYWMDLSWFGFERGHLVLGRGQRRLWRSTATYQAAHRDVRAVVFGRRRLAFVYARRWTDPGSLYIAGYGSPERLLATGERPLQVLASGELLTLRERDHALLLRAPDRDVQRFVAFHVSETEADQRSGKLVVRTRLQIGVFDRGRLRRLINLKRLGFEGLPVIEPLGRVVSIHDRRRLVIVDYHGHIVASSSLPRRRGPADGVSSAVAANSTATAFAFTVLHDTSADGSDGYEAVYVLRAGERRARAASDEHPSLQGCGRTAELSWHGDWLLYSDTAQEVAIVDGSLRQRPIELGGLISRLPGTTRDGFFEIAWAGR